MGRATSKRQSIHRSPVQTIPTTPPDPQPAPDGYMSRAETAAFTRLNIQTIDAAINASELKASKVGRRVLIRKPDVIDWLNRRQK